MPAQAGLVDLFTREDVQMVVHDLELIFELAAFSSDGPLGDNARQALFTLWRLRGQYNTLYLEENLLA